MTDGRCPEPSRRVREQTGPTWKLQWNVGSASGGRGRGCFKVAAPGFTSAFTLPAFTFLLHLVHNEAVTLLRY